MYDTKTVSATVVFVYLCILVSDQSHLSFSCSNLSAASFTASTPLKKSCLGSMNSLVWELHFIFTCFYSSLLLCRTFLMHFSGIGCQFCSPGELA